MNSVYYIARQVSQWMTAGICGAIVAWHVLAAVAGEADAQRAHPDKAAGSGPSKQAAVQDRPSLDEPNGIGQLLQTGRKSTPTAREALRKHYLELRKAAPADNRVDYAYGLALLRQHRPDVAAVVLAEVVRRQPDNLGAHQVRIWALITVGKSAEAGKAMQAMADPIAKLPAAADDPARCAAAKFLGSALGFLEGPKAPCLSKAEANALGRSLMRSLGADYDGEFDGARREVAEQFEQYRREMELLNAESQAKLEHRLQKERQKLGDAVATAESQDHVLETKSESLKKDLLERASIEMQLQVLRQKREYIDNLAGAVQYQADLMSAANQFQGGTRNVGMSRQSQFESAIATRDFNLQLSNLSFRARQIDEQILVLQGRGVALIARDEIEGTKLATKSAERAGQQRRIHAMQKAAVRPPAMLLTPELRASAAEIVDPDNYLLNPLDAEEEHLLKLQPER